MLTNVRDSGSICLQALHGNNCASFNSRFGDYKRVSNKTSFENLFTINNLLKVRDSQYLPNK